jgi:hypothetical protein
MSNHEWIRPSKRLPKPYEEVRILYEGVSRIARLGHDSKSFQLASFKCDNKYQYLIPVERVDYWMVLPFPEPPVEPKEVDASSPCKGESFMEFVHDALTSVYDDLSKAYYLIIAALPDDVCEDVKVGNRQDIERTSRLVDPMLDPIGKIGGIMQFVEKNLKTAELSVDDWAELHRLREEIKGPEGYATWKDAAVDEKVKRIKLEKIMEGVNERLDSLVNVARQSKKVEGTKKGTEQ